MRSLMILSTLLLSSALLSPAVAAPVAYDVTALDTINVMTAENETALENFIGITNKISGSVMFDAAAKTGSADLVVDGASIKTGVDARDGHMRGKNWFNFDTNPQIRFKTTKVAWVSGDVYSVTGAVTLNGVTKPVTANAKVKLTPANELTKGMRIPNDALAVNVKFSIKLSDFNVDSPAIKSGQVSNVLPISLKFIASNK